MKYLQIFNGLALALSATFFVIFGVVCLMYGYHLDASPRMRAEWPLVSGVTLVFAGMFAFSLLAFWSQRRRTAWRWPAQIALPVALVVGGMTLTRMLAG